MGAEATLYDHGEFVTKDRKPKKYRLEVIDSKIRRGRAKAEFNILSKLHGLVNVPKPIRRDKTIFTMEKIDGKKVRDVLTPSNCDKICNQIGQIVGQIHNKGIIHGDLTTSNFMQDKTKIYIIDFGLSYYSQKDEDKAVDLHLFRQAVESRHSDIWEECFKSFFEGYKTIQKDAESVIKRMHIVDERGRNKNKV